MSKDQLNAGDMPDVQYKKNNNENDKSHKTIIASIACALLLIIVIVLMVLLGLNKCQPQSNSGDSSSSEMYNYDASKLDNVFKKIVTKQMQIDALDADELTDVLAVTYTDNSGILDLDISVRSATKIYYYHLDNSSYTGYDNFVSYILDFDFDNKAGRPLDGDVVTINQLSITTDSVNTDKTCKYAISESLDGTVKYLSGFYLDEDGYHAYIKKEISGDNPFNESADKVFDKKDILYKYYASISA